MRTSSRTWYALALFVFGVAALLAVKPAFMFREDGSMYGFGTGPDRSVFSFGTAVAVLAVLSSFVFAMRDMVTSGGGEAAEAPAAFPAFPAARPLYGVPVVPGAGSLSGVSVPAARPLSGVSVVPEARPLSGVSVPEARPLSGVSVPEARPLSGGSVPADPFDLRRDSLFT